MNTFSKYPDKKDTVSKKTDQRDNDAKDTDDTDPKETDQKKTDQKKTDPKQTQIIVIAAIAKNNVIGKDNDIPWRIKEDFKHFKDMTLGYPCIMGDKTYESLPDNAKPLKQRENIVLTFDKDYHPKGTTVFDDFNKAIQYCKDNQEKKVFIIGGRTIYSLGLKVADILELTHLDKEFEGDVYFPDIDYSIWELIKKEDHVDNTYGKYSFCTYRRKIK